MHHIRYFFAVSETLNLIESALAAKMLASLIGNREAAPLSLAVSHTIALTLHGNAAGVIAGLPGPAAEAASRLCSEVAEFLKSGAVDLAIAGPLKDTWSRLDALPLFEEPFALLVSRPH